MLLLFFCKGNSQNTTSTDYEVVKELFIQLKEFNKNKFLFLEEKSTQFKYKNIFFENNYFKNYISSFPFKKRELHFLKKLDLNYLRNQYREDENWDFSKFGDKISKYTKKTPFKINYNTLIYSISIPIYSEDYKYAFIYGSMARETTGGGEENLYVLRYKGKKWKYYSVYTLSL